MESERRGKRESFYSFGVSRRTIAAVSEDGFFFPYACVPMRYPLYLKRAGMLARIKAGMLPKQQQGVRQRAGKVSKGAGRKQART